MLLYVVRIITTAVQMVRTVTTVVQTVPVKVISLLLHTPDERRCDQQCPVHIHVPYMCCHNRGAQ
jgi:hypothetical protein